MENIADATNVGAILRSAAALGIDAVLLTPECADPLCRRCSNFLGIGKKADLKRKNQKKYVFSVM